LTGDLGMAESEGWLREALDLCEPGDHGSSQELVLRHLVNLECIAQSESTAF